MPCTDGYPSNHTLALEQRLSTQRQRLDEATRLLCELCHLITTKSGLISLNNVEGLGKWYAVHQRNDELRRLMEESNR